MAAVFLWTLVGFAAGSLPFSLWMGHLLAGKDIRLYGDGNPGAANAWRAGGWRTGLPALLLDYLKGAVPTALAHFSVGLAGWALVPVALAPVMGHAFSPLLRFRGGKAVAATFGAWTGLTLGEVPIILGLTLGLFVFLQDADAWSLVGGMVVLGLYLAAVRHGPAPFLAVWAGHMAILLWKHAPDLRRRPHPRAWLVHLLGRAR
ncbi:MAG: glycerol-3-phosphate acyltransferase [Anaerolineae bacterium]